MSIIERAIQIKANRLAEKEEERKKAEDARKRSQDVVDRMNKYLDDVLKDLLNLIGIKIEKTKFGYGENRVFLDEKLLFTAKVMWHAWENPNYDYYVEQSSFDYFIDDCCVSENELVNHIASIISKVI